MKPTALTSAAILAAWGIDVTLPDLWLNAYYLFLVICALGFAGYSRGMDYLGIITALSFSYFLENDPSLWWDNPGILALCHFALAGGVWLYCGRVGAFFVSIYIAKGLAGAAFVQGLGLSDYGYHVSINILSIMALSMFIWLSFDHGRRVNKGELPNEVHGLERRVVAWIRTIARNWLY